MHRLFFLLIGVVAIAGCVESPTKQSSVSEKEAGQMYVLIVPNMT